VQSQANLSRRFERWLRDDVSYIITTQERAAFEQLSSDEARARFIEQFWRDRDPTPGTEENEFQKEHYRRIFYAYQRFAARKPGWRSDRGRAYIILGPPDEIESYPGGQVRMFPYEIWRYRSISEVGENVELEFVDPTMTGEYRLAAEPTEKLTVVAWPHQGADPADLPRRRALAGRLRLPEDRLVGRPSTPPAGAERIVTEIRAPLDGGWIQFQKTGDAWQAIVNVYGRLLSADRRPIHVFEDVLTFKRPFEPSGLEPLWFRKSLQLAAGDYRLMLVFQDQASGRTETRELTLTVPAGK
jgi:GWxTD domain-containing protein